MQKPLIRPRQSEFVQKLTAVSELRKQYRVSRAWAWVGALVVGAIFLFSRDVYWRAGAILLAIAGGYQASSVWRRLQHAEAAQLKSRKSTDSLATGGQVATNQTSSTSTGPVGSITPSTPATGFSSTQDQQRQRTADKWTQQQKQTPVQSPLAETFNSMRRRHIRVQDTAHSPIAHPENFRPAEALRLAHQQAARQTNERDTQQDILGNNRSFSGSSLSPLGGIGGGALGSSSVERKPYHASPLVRDVNSNRNNILEPRRVDALKSLGLPAIPDEWIDALKSNLGRHLYAILKCHDAAIAAMKTFLTAQIAEGKIPTDAWEKALPMLDHQVGSRKSVTLDNGTVLTIEDILRFCSQPQAPAAPAAVPGFLSFNLLAQPAPPKPGVDAELLQKYEAAWSFFKLCRKLQDRIAKQNPLGVLGEDYLATETVSSRERALETLLGNSWNQDARGGATGSGMGAPGRVGSLMQRLRELDSPDRVLRIEWGRQTRGGAFRQDFLTGRTTYELSDQDIALALFLHRCDENQARLTTSHMTNRTSTSFSDLHFSSQVGDIRHVLAQHRTDASASSLSLLDGRRSPSSFSSSATDSQLLLNVFLRNYPSEDPVASQTATETPHYDLLRISPVSQPISRSFGGGGDRGAGQHVSTDPAAYLSFLPHAKEIWSIETSRHDIFEAMIITMIIMTGTAPADDLHGSSGDEDEDDVEEPAEDVGRGRNRRRAQVPVSGLSAVRRLFRQRGLGLGSSADARVVKHLFEEVVSIPELVRMLEDFHTAQEQHRLASSGATASASKSFASPSHHHHETATVGRAWNSPAGVSPMGHLRSANSPAISPLLSSSSRPAAYGSGFHAQAPTTVGRIEAPKMLFGQTSAPYKSPLYSPPANTFAQHAAMQLTPLSSHTKLPATSSMSMGSAGRTGGASAASSYRGFNSNFFASALGADVAATPLATTR